MKRDNKQLYEHIMRNVSREVKKTLNEAGYVEPRVKKDKIYPKYLFFYIIGYDSNPYMHPHASCFNSLDEIGKLVWKIISKDDWIFGEYPENESYYNRVLEFLQTQCTKLRVGQFAQFEIKDYINFIVLKIK